MFDQVLIHAMARKAEASSKAKSSVQMADEEKKIKGPIKDFEPHSSSYNDSAILASCMMHGSKSRNEDRTRNCDVATSWEIEKIKKRLQKLFLGQHKLPPIGGSSKMGLSQSSSSSSSSSDRFAVDHYGMLTVSRCSSQDSIVGGSTRCSSHARVHQWVRRNWVAANRDCRAVKPQKKACPRCGRWCKYGTRRTSSSSVVVCPNCGKRFPTPQRIIGQNQSLVQYNTR